MGNFTDDNGIRVVKEIGDIIRSNHIPHDDISARAGITVKIISTWITGIRNPNLFYFCLMLEALGIELKLDTTNMIKYREMDHRGKNGSKSARNKSRSKWPGRSGRDQRLGSIGGRCPCCSAANPDDGSGDGSNDQHHQ